jgi:hypothetical protein
MASTEQERIWFAREVFQLFVKCFTNLKLYPHDHVHCRESLEAWSTRLRSFVHLHDVLRIGITQDTLIVLDQPVYEEANRNENLAFRLYVDGLREVSIGRGVTREEAEKLAFIFYQAVVDPTLDTTLLLWEGEFLNIQYAAINTLSEAWEQPDYMSNDALNLLDDMNRDVDQIVGLVKSGQQEGLSFELTDGASEMQEIEGLDDGLAEGQERSEDEDIYRIRQEALQSFKKEIDAWGPDRMLKGLVEACLDGLALVPDRIGRENAVWLMREAVETALRGKDLDLLSALLTRYEGELALLEEPEEEAPFREVFAWMGQPENLARLTEMAKGQGLGGPQAFCRILGLLGAPGVDAAVDAYLDADSKELKDALLAFVKSNINVNPMALEVLVSPNQPAEVVSSGLFLLSKQRNMDRHALETLLNRAREHEDTKISEYATHLWRTMTDGGRIEGMMGALKAESRRDRLRAIQILVQAGHTPAVEAMRAVVESKDFLGRDQQERQAYLEAIRVLGGQGSIGFLQRQTQRATGVFNRKAVKEIRALAEQQLNQLRERR